MDKKKGFVCQSCGKAVSAYTEKCPHCGKFFKGVRCPKCLYVGESSFFVKGCPSCGYLGDEADNAGFSDSKKKNKKNKPIPLWFLLFSAGFLILIIIILIYIFFRM
jgi:uncharacterized membrane protein YvbJ